jgi:hypothetical protein
MGSLNTILSSEMSNDIADRQQADWMLQMNDERQALCLLPTVNCQLVLG